MNGIISRRRCTIRDRCFSGYTDSGEYRDIVRWWESLMFEDHSVAMSQDSAIRVRLIGGDPARCI